MAKRSDGQPKRHAGGGCSRVRQADTRARQALFLSAFADLGTVRHAAEAAGIDRQTHYRWLAADEEYAAAFAHAEEEAADKLEREARRRAQEGWDEPVYQGGKMVGTVRRYSDPLLIFLLRGARPDRYKDRMEHTGPGGGPLRSQVRVEVGTEHLTDEERREMIRLAAEAEGLLPPCKDGGETE